MNEYQRLAFEESALQDPRELSAEAPVAQARETLQGPLAGVDEESHGIRLQRVEAAQAEIRKGDPHGSAFP